MFGSRGPGQRLRIDFPLTPSLLTPSVSFSILLFSSLPDSFPLHSFSMAVRWRLRWSTSLWIYAVTIISVILKSALSQHSPSWFMLMLYLRCSMYYVVHLCNSLTHVFHNSFMPCCIFLKSNKINWKKKIIIYSQPITQTGSYICCHCVHHEQTERMQVAILRSNICFCTLKLNRHFNNLILQRDSCDKFLCSSIFLL